jgi:tetratricopeptide (TPR) repeat protein
VSCVAFVAGCAYYNGLFNANRLANEARRAEREGRTSEARSLWSRAAVKAESVASRFPRSKYRDDALVLQGTALSRLGSCSQAVRALQVAADSSPDRAMRGEARLLIGGCWLTLQQPESAAAALADLADAGDSVTRGRFLLVRGEAKVRLGRDSAALADLAASAAPEAVFPTATALARLGHVSEATAALERAVERPYVESRWLEALDTLGTRAPHEASRLVNVLLGAGRLPEGQRARLLLGDGERWLRSGDTNQAVPRLAAVAATVPDSGEGQVARAHLAVRSVRAADRVAAIPELIDSLAASTRAGGAALRVGGRFQSVLTRAHEAMLEAESPMPLFFAAEDVRDSLATPALAADLFIEVARRYAESVVAPKALLAAALLRPDAADSLIARVRQAYPASVYTLALDGLAGDRFRVVEDSLHQLGRNPPQRRGAAAADRRVRNER